MMEANAAYRRFVKPRLAEVLHALGLDVAFHRAQGDRAYYRDVDGQEVAVLDLVGGYGSLMLGHNPPEVVAELQNALAAGMVVHAQFSIRHEAGALAQQLNEIARRDSGVDEDFVVHFANSGAEAVELAIKHAEYARWRQQQALREELDQHRCLVQAALRDGQVLFDADILRGSALDTAGTRIHCFADLCAVLDAHHQQLWRRPPMFIALERAFHGKLMGSVQTTHNDVFRAPFGHLGLQVQFVPSDDTAALERAATEASGTAFDLLLEDGRLRLAPRPVRGIGAILVEPIQGEGGIHVLTPAFAQALRRLCHRHGCPLLVDEVQSGMGRSGRFFAASKLGLKGDTYVLSKSLGGGVAKIAAVLIRKSQYERDFCLIHSSTFAEDDVSCRVARRVLDLLERDNGRLYHLAHEKGERLRAMLEGLRARYPAVIQAVRGEGLLLGVEFASLAHSPSQLLRTLEHNRSLGYFLAGYLFHGHRIRVAPSASAPRVLRLEPSVYLDQPDIEQIETALAAVCEMVQRQDLRPFVFALTSRTPPRPHPAGQEFTPKWTEPVPPPRTTSKQPVRKIAFINHLIDARNLAGVEPSLRECTDAELAHFIERLSVDPRAAPYPPVRIQSPTGSAIDFILYPLGITSRQMAACLDGTGLQDIRDAVQERVVAARNDGCEIAGLGMYTSIVTHNGLSLQVPGIRLTTGNALTVSMAFEAMEQAASQRALDWRHATGVVVGATGNIASICAELLARKVTRLVLIGSGKSSATKRLERVRSQIFGACWRQLRLARHDNTLDRLEGIPGALARHPWVTVALEAGPPDDLPDADFLLRCGRTDLILIGKGLSDVGQGDVVLCGASHPQPFLEPEHFKYGAMVCDVAVPNNVQTHVAARRPDLWLGQGGVVGTPHGESLPPGARAFLGAGQLFACMAETAVLGLAGLDRHYSLGDLDARQVEEIAALARLHGFRLSDVKREPSL